MNPPKKIKKKLSIACCALLGISGKSIHATEPVDIDIGFMSYVEKARSGGIELLINGRTKYKDGDYLAIAGVFDSITGASPNGASPSNVPQTFTNSSGFGSYSVAPGRVPTDSSHADSRLAVSTLYGQRVNSDTLIDYSGHLSMEFDYVSVGTGIEVAYDFNKKNTTLIYGFEYEFVRTHSVGGIPIPYASMQPVGSQQPIQSVAETKRIGGATIGVTQVINKRSLLQAKYSYSIADGYLTDPYRIISVIDDVNLPTLGDTLDYIYEARPGDRKINSTYMAYKANRNGSIFDISWRYYWDDWDIRSNTLDLKYKYRVGDRNFMQPHLRLYSQSAAEFYKHSLPASQTPKYASADARLAEFNAFTLGFKYGTKYVNNKEQSFGVEWYRQVGDSHPADAVGLQTQLDLFPTLDTLILTYKYSYLW